MSLSNDISQLKAKFGLSDPELMQAINQQAGNLEYHLTFDIDWAPDESIALCLSMLQEAGVKATFFTTHRTDLNKEITQQGHELGIHPNFLPNSSHGKSVKEIIDSCLAFAPNARFMRTHALVQSSPLLCEIFGHYSQLTTDISLFMQGAEYVQKSHFNFDGVTFERILYNWEDDATFGMNDFDYTKAAFHGARTIYDFHPIHVHLNSTDGSEYGALKKAFAGKPLMQLSGQEVDEFKNHDAGVRHFLQSVLDSKNKPFLLEDM